MTILYTESFADAMEEYRGKQYIDRDDFLDRILQRLLSDPLYLCRPYIKLKLTFREHALRVVLRFEEEKQIIIPLFITDKTDKVYGYNMTRNTLLQKKVLHRMRLATEDLNNNKVKILHC